MKTAMMCLALSMALPAQGHAYELKRADTGEQVSWHKAEVVYRMERQGAQDLTEAEALRAVKGAFGAWNQAADGLRLVFGGVIDGVPMGYDSAPGATNHNVVHFSRSDWAFDSSTALAVTLTTFRANAGSLVDADIVVNEVGYTWGAGAEADYDLQNTLAHEAGHFLGLAHSDEPEATMYARAAPHETKKRDLHLDDLQGIQAIYGGDWRPPESEEQLEPLPPRGCAAAPWAGDPPTWVWAFALAGLLAWWRRRALAVVTVFGALFMAHGPAHASTFRALTLEALVDRADWVVEGPVLAVEARWEAGLIVTHAKIAVDTCHQGACGESVWVRTVGGRVGDLVQVAEGLARFEVGERALVFVAPARPDGVRSVVGLGQGKFSVVAGPAGGWAFRTVHPLPLVGADRAQARTLRAVSAARLRAALARMQP